jgi:competence protein ComEC
MGIFKVFACAAKVTVVAATVLLAACQSTGTPRVATQPEPPPGPSAPVLPPAEHAADGPPVASTGPTSAVAVTPTAPAREPVRTVTPTEIAMPAGLPEARADDNAMVAHFIDVGQGDATLLEFSCAAVLIDTGGETTERVSGNDRLKAYLNEFFDRRADLARTLQLVVLSHPHPDHTNGVSVLLDPDAGFTILNVLDDGPPSAHAAGRKGQNDLRAYAEDNADLVGYVGLAESDIKTVSGVTGPVIDPVNCRKNNRGVDPKIIALWGRVDLDTTWADNANNDSVVLRVSFGKASFLFTGDLQSDGIAAMLESYAADVSIFDTDVLKVGHHGSHNATTPEFVTAITPKIAVIQSGDSSPDTEQYSAYAYGHPNVKALTMLIDPTDGVALSRDAKQVRVGIRGRHPITRAPPEFTMWTMRKAIYSNAWDGNIAIRATADGELSVETEY